MSLTRFIILEYNQTLRNRLVEKFTKEEPRLTDVSINAYLDRFKELRHRFPSDKRDITKLSWKEVEGLVDSFVSTKAKLGEVKITSDQNLVYDNGAGIRVFKGSDRESCIKYSTGYTFCIGSKDQGRNMYDRYRSQYGGGTPYFVINQNLPTSHEYHLSVVYKFGAKDDYFNITDAKNDHDNEKEFESKQQFKRFYEKQFNINLDDKFVEVFKADPLDIIKEIIKPIDKGDHYLSEGDVNLSVMGLKSLKFFDKPWIVRGHFSCSDNQLTSLEGAPRFVGGGFICSSNQLESLEGAPQQVSGDFSCSINKLKTLKGAPQRMKYGFYCYNNQLTTLEGAPQTVGGNFQCFENQLSSLEGAPHTVGGDFGCSRNQLITLKGAPQRVGESFNCSYNKLKNLEGAPQSVGVDFYCFNNQLKNLEGAPQTVGGDLKCSHNQLSSLEGAPQEVGGSFDCDFNRLLSLEGAPQYVGVDFYCNDNQLTSLEGAPQQVDRSFFCSNNQLISLKGGPQKVGRGFYYSSNPNLSQEEITTYLQKIGKK